MATSDSIGPSQDAQGDVAKIAELERALRECRTQLRAASEALTVARTEASTGSWECDVATMQVRWSAGLKEMLGISATGATEDMLSRIHPDNREAWLAQIDSALLAATPINIEVRVKRTGRHFIWLHFTGRVVGEGSTRRIVGSAQDVSFRKHAELERVHIKERFELALQSLSVGIWDWDLIDRRLYWSPQYKQMLGIRDPAFVPRPSDFERRMHPDDARAVTTALREHIKQGANFDVECRLLHEDGHYLWTRLCGVSERNAAGKALRMIGSVDDISMRKESERKLSEREARLRNMFEHAVDGLITIDVHGIIQSFNPACEKMFGYEAREVIGQNVSMLMPEPYRREHDAYVGNFLRTRQPKIIGIGREVEGRRKNGSVFPLDLSISQFEAGTEKLFSGIVRDITGRKEIERMKNEFISVVSHELRTPLTSIRGSLGLLTANADRSSTDDRTRELLSIAHRNSQLLMVLINDILDIEKLESGTMKLNLRPVRLEELLADAVRANSSYASRFDVSLKLLIEPELPAVMADPDRLMQVMANLLSNAAKFTREGTTVDIRAERKDRAVRISVRDRGKGVPDDMKAILFDKFSQADPSTSRERAGTGLGLSIARHFARLMHGEIDFTSHRGKGATFYIDLPVAGDPTTVSPDATPRRRKTDALVIGAK